MLAAMAMESLSEALRRLGAAGYTESFRAEPDGLRAVESGCIHEPESLRIEEIVRFEGDSDPQDEAVVFALRCPEHSARGTYVVAYGPGMAPLDVQMVQRLTDARRR